MAKMKGFFTDCSSRSCQAVNAEVARDYDRVAHKGKPPPHYKGGIKTILLETAQVPIVGSREQYMVSQHGVGVEFRRCKEFNYIDRHTHKQTSQTCTEKIVYNIPRDITRCYEHTTSLLQQMEKSKKKEGKPVGIRHRILALVACSGSHPLGLRKGEMYQAMSPAIISAVTGDKHNAVRKSVEHLVKSKKLVTAGKLAVIDEQQLHLPQKYQQVFDDFLQTEREERIRLGVRRLTADFVPSEVAPDEPEAEQFTNIIRQGWRMPKGYKMSEKRKAMQRIEAEEWKRRTRIAPPSYEKEPKKPKRKRKPKL